MDNPEYTFQILEVFSKIRTKEIPRELEGYISYVARTGDTVFQWSLVKVLLREKLLSVLEEFLENGSPPDIPPCPNVDLFNYENMKSDLLSRLDSFILPPFTIQRICELLATPKKEYNRIDKYMRAVEKNVLVVSSSDLTLKRNLETDGNDSMINGILYDKLNDSLNSFTNHIFSEEHEDELNVSSKLDETDAVQQIIDESWNEENNDEFKLNGSNNSSALNVTFENELQFIADKSGEEKNTSCESKESDSSFDNSSMLIEPTIHNIIEESSDISFENITDSDSSFEDSSTKNDTYEFKDDSVLEDSNTSLVSENEMFSASSNDMEVDNRSISADENHESTLSMDVSKMVEEKSNSSEYENEFTDTKGTDLAESIEDTTQKKSVDYTAESSESTDSTTCEEQTNTTLENFTNSVQVEENEFESSTVNEDGEVGTSTPNEEKSFSAGDNEELIEKNNEEVFAGTETNIEIESELPEPSSSSAD